MLFFIKILAPTICFATGFFIPMLTRFLMKFYPCSLHSYIGDIIKFCFNKNRHKLNYNNKRHNYLKKQLFLNQVLWGILYLSFYVILTKINIFQNIKTNTLILFFIILFLLGFSANIDNKFKIIPDIITYPLFMLIFLLSTQLQNNQINIFEINPIYSILSSIITYILCTITALIFYLKNPYSFGGGDVKLLSAIAGFIGLKNIPILLFLSFIISILLFLIKKDRYVKLSPIIFISFLLLTTFKIII